MIITDSQKEIVPRFVKGQPLRSADLNNMVSYLDGEPRDSRVFLEGWGIFYGLELQWNDDTLTITAGAAVSSDGYLFAVEQAAAREDNKTLSFKGVQSGSFSISGKSTKLDGYSFTTEKSTSSGQPDIAKIVNDSSYIILLLVEQNTEVKRDCLLAYDDNSNRDTLNFRVVALKSAEFNQSGSTGNSGPEFLPAPFMHRFGYQEKNQLISFKDFTNWKNIFENFNLVCSTAEILIQKAYVDIFEQASRFFALTQPGNPFEDLADQLAGMRKAIPGNGAKAYWLPYYYDHLNNLINAWLELRLSNEGARFSSLPNRKAFPGYVILGRVNDPQYRTKLYRPPFNDKDKGSLNNVKAFIDRMVELTGENATSFPKKDLITGAYITPGGSLLTQLSQQGIHFYYQQKDRLGKVWDPAINSRPRRYPVTGISDRSDHEQLMQQMSAFGFYHVYGHVGQDLEEAVNDISERRSQLHIPFNLQVVYMDDSFEQSMLPAEYTASFVDLGMLLQTFTEELLCAKDCRKNLPGAIFGDNGGNGWDNAMRLTALRDFFRDAPDPNKLTKDWLKWAGRYCNENCESFIDCCFRALESLWSIANEYSFRLNKILDGLLFTRFARAHPGLEHAAGVPAGGTLVLLVDKVALTDDEKKIREKLLNASGNGQLLENFSDTNNVVVADFCLPYICCSQQPSINIEIKPVPPVADFEESGREEIIDEEADTIKGYKLFIANNSRNATSFRWRLFDKSGQPIGPEVKTSNTNPPPPFELHFAKGSDFTIKLVAERGELNDNITKPFNICGIEDGLALNLNGKDNTVWSKGKPNPVLNAAPYGGEFIITNNKGVIILVPGFFKWNYEHKTVELNTIHANLPDGIYTITYGFGSCGKVNFTLVIKGGGNKPVDGEPGGGIEIGGLMPPMDPETGMTKAQYNQRAKRYHTNWVQAADNAAFKKTDLFSPIKTFFSIPKEPDPAKDQEAGTTAFNNLLTEFIKSQANTDNKISASTKKLILSATALFLDKQVYFSPGKAIVAATSALKKTAATLTSAGAAPSSLIDIWKPEDISTDFNKTSIDTYKALFV